MKDIILKNISFGFSEKTVINNFSYTFKAGSIVHITGPSGCGKSTLARLIAGLICPCDGTILNIPSQISMVFQDDRLCEEFNAVSNVALALNKPKKIDIIENFKKINIDNFISPVGYFSGGMKRRVAIVRAVMRKSDLIIFDEAFKGLDNKLKYTVMDYVKNNLNGRTAIFITHNEDEINYFGGDVINL